MLGWCSMPLAHYPHFSEKFPLPLSITRLHVPPFQRRSCPTAHCTPCSCHCTPKVRLSAPAAPYSSTRPLVAENDFVASAPALSPLDLRPPLSNPVGIYVAAIAIKGRVARDEEHIGTPASGRVRVILLKTRRRRGASPGPMETTTRSSSKGSVWALPGGTQTEPSPLMGN